MGDSTTRSDIRALEETFKWPRTNLDEAQVFQKRDANSKGYICKLHEQSMNLTKCGIPPIIDTQNIRYFYKVYPWSPLDQWYFREKPDLFRDIDVLVISLGRWLKYRPEWNEPQKLATDMELFLENLEKVFSGKILYQSEYAGHTVSLEKAKYPVVNCTHGLCGTKPNIYECEQTITEDRPQRDLVIRSVMEGHGVPYLDRWNVSKTLPLEYYERWLCGKPSFHAWYCNHHLHFVAMEHFRLLAHVVRSII
jgi:hypothetical protein